MSTIPQNVLTKYAVVRAPRSMPEESVNAGLVLRPQAASPLWDRLNHLLSSESKSVDFLAAAKSYLDEHPVNEGSEFAAAFQAIIDRSTALPSYNSPLALLEQLKVESNPFADEAKQHEFSIWLWDQLAARLIVNSQEPTRQRPIPQNLVRTLAYLKLLETASNIPDGDITSASALNPEIVLPAQLGRFVEAARRDEREAKEAEAKEAADALQAASLQNAQEAVAAGSFAKFIASALEAGEVEVEDLPAPPQPPAAGPTPGGGATDPGESSGTSIRQSLVLTGQALSRLPSELAQYAVDEWAITDLKKADVLALLQKATRSAEQARTKLLARAAGATKVRGLDAIEQAADRVLAKEAIAKEEATLIVRMLLASPTETLPDFSNPNPIRVAGLCDLKVVRQQLQKYSLGEIAYIENVLAGEERSRTHHRLDRTEQQLIFETEESTSTERDLQTTDRFELNQELENVEKESKSTDIGVNVTGSYGAVTVAAHANSTNTSAAENAQKTARATVKENVSKAIDRVQKRTRRQETVTVTTEISEDNVHRFVATGNNIVGLYRYVEKNYWCQVYNYGARLMLEFLVPEPAAGYLYFQAKAPRTDAHLIAPEPPNFLPEDLTDSKYQSYASRYNAQVSAPPPAYRFANVLTDHKDQESKPVVNVEAGYEAAYAYLAISFQFRDKAASISVIMGANIWTLRAAPNAPIEGSSSLYVPARGTLGFHVQVHRTDQLPWSVGMTVVLRRTDEALKKWQLDTYRAIIDAYQVAKDEYEKKLAASKSNSRNVTLRSDLEYRNTERTELKRGVLEIMTNQHFQSMGAIGVAKVGDPPVINPIKALMEEPTVKFFEQAFEWTNMTYTFYPYFWGRPDSWEDRLSLSDADPVFSRFLGAGYARVVVPVRRYFENNIKYYLDYGSIWEGGDCPLPGDPDYVSIIDEIKEIESAGSPDLLDGIPDGDPWRITIPTPLVCLDDPKVKLPSWEIIVPNTSPYEPSKETCNGVPFNAAQWPNDVSIVIELGALGYKVPNGEDQKDFLKHPDGKRTARAFQRRMNELGIADALGSPLKIDGIVGPCTRRALTVAAEWRKLKQWPGPA